MPTLHLWHSLTNYKSVKQCHLAKTCNLSISTHLLLFSNWHYMKAVHCTTFQFFFTFLLGFYTCSLKTVGHSHSYTVAPLNKWILNPELLHLLDYEDDSTISSLWFTAIAAGLIRSRDVLIDLLFTVSFPCESQMLCDCISLKINNNWHPKEKETSW